MAAARRAMSTMSATAQRWVARRDEVVKKALAAKLVGESVPSAMFLDGERVRDRVTSLKRAFHGDHFLHTFAAKGNPTLRVLEMLGRSGMGVEAASFGELYQALNCNRTDVPVDKIVYDAPVKTVQETTHALQSGAHLNVDNMDELRRLAKIIEDAPADSPIRNHGKLGIRINPQVGAGTIAAFSTAGKSSKFGTGLEDHKDDLLDAYAAYPWLNMLHLHVGSQGVAPDLAVAGIRRVVDLAHEINKRAGRQQVTHLDVGGGMSVNFGSEEVDPEFDDLAAVYKASVPELFSGEFTVLTEFGRAIIAKAGFALSRIEFTKVSGGRHIALQHVGADLMVRTVYHPDSWPLRMDVYDKDGERRDMTDGTEVYDVGGPCCFQGDIIAHQREMATMTAGDWLMVHDVGGYYHSSFSVYNVRQCPAIYGYSWGQDGSPGKDARPDGFTLLQQAQTLEETCRFFSHNE